MHKYAFALLVLFLCSCKKEETNISEESKPKNNPESMSILNKVANAYGFEKWEKVEEVNFSFVVNPGENERVRQWRWRPKLNEITLFDKGDEITYNKMNVDEGYVDTDKAFVNDSFWLLFPFHLVWDEIDYSYEEEAVTPIGGSEASKLTVNYPKEGGYTPGDKYIVYLDEDLHILEWSYHPRGQKEAALVNTFEDLSQFNGIYVNLVHRNPSNGFQLVFRDVSFN